MESQEQEDEVEVTYIEDMEEDPDAETGGRWYPVPAIQSLLQNAQLIDLLEFRIERR